MCMTYPDWLTVPAAPIAAECAADATLRLTRIGQLGVLAHPLLAERYHHAARSDIQCGLAVIRSEILDPSCCCCTSVAPLDRHRLDVALSRGRHAAERAKLAGCQVLLCRGVTDDSEQAIWPFHRFDVAVSPHVAYAQLQQRARFESAALTGALIAGAQMGLYLAPRGQTAWQAAELAQTLHVGVGEWLICQVQTMPQPCPQSGAIFCDAGASFGCGTRRKIRNRCVRYHAFSLNERTNVSGTFFNSPRDSDYDHRKPTFADCD